MPKKLTSLTWADMKEQMSIAGSPDKIAELGDSLMKQISSTVDYTNPAEIINAQLMLNRILAEIKLMKRMYENRTGQEIG